MTTSWPDRASWSSMRRASTCNTWPPSIVWLIGRPIIDAAVAGDDAVVAVADAAGDGGI